MNEEQNSKKYDLAERTFCFAKECRFLVKQLPKTISNFEDSKQLVRSSGSVHANYIEANESLSKKDFYYRIKVCRKEAKESHSWLRLLDVDNILLNNKREDLIEEAFELVKIFGAIISRG